MWKGQKGQKQKMRTIYNLAAAGMAMAAMAEAVRAGKLDAGVPDYETRKYLIEKLEEAFFSIQGDITEAVVTAAQNMAESEDQ